MGPPSEPHGEPKTQEDASRVESLDRQVAGVRADPLQLRQEINDDPKFPLLWFFIRRTTDFVALLALFLSICAILLQGLDYYERAHPKPKPELFPPEQIVIYKSDIIPEFKNAKVNDQVIFAAITSYINTAPKDNDALVRTEFLRANVGLPRESGMKIVQQWVYETGNSDTPGQFIFDKKGAPVPFVVPGDGAFRHEVLFQSLHEPRCVPNDWGCEGVDLTYDWSEFMNDIVRKGGKISIEVGAEIEGRKSSLKKTCGISLKPSQIDVLNTKFTYWPECRQENQ